MKRIFAGVITAFLCMVAIAQDADVSTRKGDQAVKASETVQADTTKPGLALCFAPGTSDEVVQQAYANAAEEDLGFFRLGTRWSTTSLNGGGLGLGVCNKGVGGARGHRECFGINLVLKKIEAEGDVVGL